MQPNPPSSNDGKTVSPPAPNRRWRILLCLVAIAGAVYVLSVLFLHPHLVVENGTSQPIRDVVVSCSKSVTRFAEIPAHESRHVQLHPVGAASAVLRFTDDKNELHAVQACDFEGAIVALVRFRIDPQFQVHVWEWDFPEPPGEYLAAPEVHQKPDAPPAAPPQRPLI